MAGISFFYLLFTTPVRFEGVTLLSSAGIFYTYWLIDSGLKLTSDLPALEADEEGIIIRGKWLKTYELTWEEIESIEYTKRMALFRRKRGKDALIIHLTDTEKIIFEIEQLLESPKDILLAIEDLAPDVPILDSYNLIWF